MANNAVLRRENDPHRLVQAKEIALMASGRTLQSDPLVR
jgi:hypothetical protein